MWPLVVVSVLQPSLDDLRALAHASIRPRTCRQAMARSPSVWQRRLRPKHDRACNKLALAAAELRHDPKRALALSLEVARGSSEKDAANWLALLAADRLGDQKTARATLHQLERRKAAPPPSPAIHFARARTLAAAGRIDDAGRGYLRALPLATLTTSARQRIELQLEAALGVARVEFAKKATAADARSPALARSLMRRAGRTHQNLTIPVAALIFRMANRHKEADRLLAIRHSHAIDATTLRRVTRSPELTLALSALLAEHRDVADAQTRWKALASKATSSFIRTFAQRQFERLEATPGARKR